MRLSRGVAFVGFLALAVAASTPAATTSPQQADPLVTVTYSGKLDARAEILGTKPGGPDIHESHIAWSLVWQGELSKLKVNATQRFATKNLKGTVEYVDRVNPPSVKGSQRNDCTGKYSARPETRVPVVVTLDPDNKKGFGVQLTRPTSETYVISSNKKSNYDYCTRVFAGVLPNDSQKVSPFFRFPSKGGTHHNPIRYKHSTSADDRNTTVVDETVSLTVEGVTPEPPAPAVDVKKLARDYLRLAIEGARGSCFHLAISLGVIGSGAVWTSIGAPIPGGIPAGAALITTGAVMVNAMTPICTELVLQVIVLYSIYERDPPVPDIAFRVQLPSCTRWEGKVRVYCVELSEAVRKLTSTERKVLPALKRLQSAGTRLAAARAAGNTQAAKKAQTSVNSAAASLQAARSASRAAGKAVARVIRAAGVRGVLTKAESAHVVDALLAELAKRGVPTADVRRIAPQALRPGPIDVLATLGK